MDQMIFNWAVAAAGAARELSRQVIRDYDVKYPKETAPVDAVDIIP